MDADLPAKHSSCLMEAVWFLKFLMLFHWKKAKLRIQVIYLSGNELIYWWNPGFPIHIYALQFYILKSKKVKKFILKY